MSLMNFTKNNLRKDYFKRIHYLMGAFLSIEIFYSDEERAKKILEAAFGEGKRIERCLSRFDEASPVFVINERAHKTPCKIDDELFRLIEDCLRVSDITGGAFDITVATLMELWADAEKRGALPCKEDILSCRKGSGYRNIVLNEKAGTVYFKTPVLKIDFGAVGKGYALDRIILVLKEAGIRKARLDFGGHLYYFDMLSKVDSYIGIRNPLKPDEIIATMPLNDRSVSTSANYERNFNIQGVFYGHLIDPMSGYPVTNGTVSASVFSPNAMVSDMLSTAVFVLGLDEGMRLVRKIKEADAVIITDNNGKPEVYYSKDSRKEIPSCV